MVNTIHAGTAFNCDETQKPSDSQSESEINDAEDELSLNYTDNDQNSECGEKPEFFEEFHDIDYVFGTFQEKFEMFLGASFQALKETTTKFQELQQEMSELAEEVTIENTSLQNRKRGAMEFVNSFK